MEQLQFMDNAKVMAKGQITIPKDVRKALGVESGDRVYFVVTNEGVTMVNSAVYALMKLQNEMLGEAEKAGFSSEEDVANWITQSRRKEAANASSDD